MGETSAVRHGIGTIETDFIGGRYIAVCECGWESGQKANRSLAEWSLSVHRGEAGSEQCGYGGGSGSIVRRRGSCEGTCDNERPPLGPHLQGKACVNWRPVEVDEKTGAELRTWPEGLGE